MLMFIERNDIRLSTVQCTQCSQPCFPLVNPSGLSSRYDLDAEINEFGIWRMKLANRGAQKNSWGGGGKFKDKVTYFSFTKISMRRDGAKAFKGGGEELPPPPGFVRLCWPNNLPETKEKSQIKTGAFSLSFPYVKYPLYYILISQL